MFFCITATGGSDYFFSYSEKKTVSVFLGKPRIHNKRAVVLTFNSWLSK